MIKLISLVVPRPGIDLQEFHDLWRHPHGTLAQNYRPLRRYQQNHRIDSDAVGPNTTRFEGVTEACFDSVEIVASLAGDPYIVNVIFADEARFEDRGATIQFLAEEEILPVRPTAELDRFDPEWTDNNRPFVVKVLQLIPAGADGSWAGHDDADLSRRVQAFRHVRSRTVGDNRPFEGMRELFWPTLRAFERGVAADPDAWAALRHRPAGSHILLNHTERLV